jgi:hypothetical protein
MAEIAELKQDLIEYGRHSPGCPRQWGSKYKCKCGWLKVMEDLKGKDGKEHNQSG